MSTLATLDGGMGYCLPLPEKTYRRLFMLQNVLLTHMEHLCGLNPKSFRYVVDIFQKNEELLYNLIHFRTIKSQKKLSNNPSRCIVDGELLWSFLNLPINEKQDVAKKIGTKMEEIIADLVEINNITSVF